jgi:magnesium transporter
MERVILQETGLDKPLWLDVEAPAAEDLARLGTDYRLHPEAIADCMEPMHLPKYEKLGDVTFMIVRTFDADAKASEDDIHKLTKKLALFLGNRFLLTVHRRPEPFIEQVAAYFRDPKEPVVLQVVLLELLLAAVETYHVPLEQAELQLQEFEQRVLRRQQSDRELAAAFRLKNRLMVIKRMLWHLSNTVQKFVPYSSVNQPLCQDVRERIENLQFFADSLLDDLNNLMNLHLQLGAKSANEVMKILTLFSVFFMPLTFIVGVYGMNFEVMPELKWRYGYPLVWAVMGLVTLGIFAWFRRKKWL